MSDFGINGTQFAPHAQPANGSNALVQEVYYLLLNILAQQSGVIAKVFIPQLETAEKYQNATASLLAMLRGQLGDRDLNLFGNWYPKMLEWMNDPNVPIGVRNYLKEIIGSPYFRPLFDKLHAAISRLNALEKEGLGPNNPEVKAARKAVIEADEKLRFGHNAIPPKVLPIGVDWKTVHDRFSKALNAAQTLSTLTRDTATVIYEKTLNAVNTITGVSKYLSAMIKRGYDVNQFVENNILS